MSDENCVVIEIIKELPFFGQENTLESRLRNVRLRGFPDVRIYENAKFKIIDLSLENIKNVLCVPQLNVYKTHLTRIDSLYELFQEQGIDILQLDKAYDFIATSESGEQTEWTILPPIAEKFFLSATSDGKVDYSNLIGDKLKKKLNEERLGINPETKNIDHPLGMSGDVIEINDGSHRVHYGVENNIGSRILIAEGMTQGFPYYAVPQPYSSVIVLEKEDPYAPETKIHIVDVPGHKHLYRLFPSGGIMSGTVRFDPKLKEKQ